MTQVRFLSAGAVAGDADMASRRVSWVFSNEDVCLDQHTIRTDGWDLTGYLRNPVLLFAHDQSQPPVGRVENIEKRGKLLVGDTVFADADAYPFADTIFRLIKGRFLNATSVSWFPLESRAARDKSRPDGIDFLRQKLLEISVVPVPANPAALATARDVAGIDVSTLAPCYERMLDGAAPLMAPRREVETIWRSIRPAPLLRARAAEWKCGASRNLSLDEDSSWDGPAAAKAIFAACGFDGDKPDVGKARKAFLAYDSASPGLRGSYKLPFATLVDGRMVAVAAGLRAAASRLPKTDIPDDVADKARAVIDHYEGKMTKTDRALHGVPRRGLYEVANLACLLGQLGYIKTYVDREEAEEGDDGSPNPENMLAAVKAVGAALVAMSQEEVAELIEQFDGADADDDDDMERALTKWRARSLAARVRKLTRGDGDAIEAVHEHCARSARLMRTHIDNYKGEDVSDDDVRAAMFDNAEAVHDHCVASAARLRSFIDTRKAPDADPAPAAGDKPPPADPAPQAGRAAAPTAEDRRREAATLLAKSLIHD